MEENKDLLKEKFQRGKELGVTVNNARAVINNLKNQVYIILKYSIFNDDIQIEEIRKQKGLLGLVSNSN